MTISDTLRRAYLATAYRAKTPQGLLTLRIGEACPALDVLLDAHGVADWAFVTAWNPRSRPTELAVNEAAQRRLRETLAATGHATFVGAGVPADPAWSPEPSVLVLGMTREAAVELGRAFEQNAVVVGRRGEPARLAECFPPRGTR